LTPGLVSWYIKTGALIPAVPWYYLEMSQGPVRVVILGAGVIGMTIACIISSDPSNTYEITIIARDMPEDVDSQGWASPWAGANWSQMPMGGVDERIKKWETVTFNKFWDMIPTGLVKTLPSRVYSLEENGFSDPWYKDLPRDVTSSFSYKTSADISPLVPRSSSPRNSPWIQIRH